MAVLRISYVHLLIKGQLGISGIYNPDISPLLPLPGDGVFKYLQITF